MSAKLNQAMNRMMYLLCGYLMILIVSGSAIPLCALSRKKQKKTSLIKLP